MTGSKMLRITGAVKQHFEAGNGRWDEKIGPQFLLKHTATPPQLFCEKTTHKKGHFHYVEWQFLDPGKHLFPSVSSQNNHFYTPALDKGHRLRQTKPFFVTSSGVMCAFSSHHTALHKHNSHPHRHHGGGREGWDIWWHKFMLWGLIPPQALYPVFCWFWSYWSRRVLSLSALRLERS